MIQSPFPFTYYGCLCLGSTHVIRALHQLSLVSAKSSKLKPICPVYWSIECAACKSLCWICFDMITNLKRPEKVKPNFGDVSAYVFRLLFRLLRATSKLTKAFPPSLLELAHAIVTLPDVVVAVAVARAQWNFPLASEPAEQQRLALLCLPRRDSSSLRFGYVASAGDEVGHSIADVVVGVYLLRQRFSGFQFFSFSRAARTKNVLAVLCTLTWLGYFISQSVTWPVCLSASAAAAAQSPSLNLLRCVSWTGRQKIAQRTVEFDCEFDRIR